MYICVDFHAGPSKEYLIFLLLYMKEPHHRQGTSSTLFEKCNGCFNISCIGLTDVRRLGQWLNVPTQGRDQLNSQGKLDLFHSMEIVLKYILKKKVGKSNYHSFVCSATIVHSSRTFIWVITPLDLVWQFGLGNVFMSQIRFRKCMTRIR